jgi:hypothetical protein
VLLLPLSVNASGTVWGGGEGGGGLPRGPCLTCQMPGCGGCLSLQCAAGAAALAAGAAAALTAAGAGAGAGAAAAARCCS